MAGEDDIAERHFYLIISPTLVPNLFHTCILIHEARFFFSFLQSLLSLFDLAFLSPFSLSLYITIFFSLFPFLSIIPSLSLFPSLSFFPPLSLISSPFPFFYDLFFLSMQNYILFISFLLSLSQLLFLLLNIFYPLLLSLFYFSLPDYIPFTLFTFSLSRLLFLL